MDKSSTKILLKCHPSLGLLLYTLNKYQNFIITRGFIPKEKQNILFNKGVLSNKWPKSKHNSNPARAVDIKLTTTSRNEYLITQGMLQILAWQLGIEVNLDRFISGHIELEG